MQKQDLIVEFYPKKIYFLYANNKMSIKYFIAQGAFIKAD